MWPKVQLPYINNNGTGALWSAGPWVNPRCTPEWVARHTKPFKTVIDSSVCTCQLVHTHGQVCNSMRYACPQNVTCARVDKEERLGSTKMKMEKEKKKQLGKFLQFHVVPESSLNVRLFLKTPDDLSPPGTNVTHPGVTIAMYQLDIS